jgi:hypothetical protein
MKECPGARTGALIFFAGYFNFFLDLTTILPA